MLLARESRPARVLNSYLLGIINVTSSAETEFEVNLRSLGGVCPIPLFDP